MITIYHFIAKKLFADIRFWIVFFFIVRLYGITNPPLEVNTNWRQCDVLMIARNFFETDANILYPRVDMAGTHTGIVGSEFPLYNYSIYTVSLVFGYNHWYGRIINLVLTSLGAFFFFALVRDYFNERAAFAATILFLISQGFALSRTTLPDPFALSFCFFSLYYGLKYLREGDYLPLFLFLILGAIGCLSKISAATLLTVLAIPIIDKSILVKRKLMLTAAGLIVLTMVVAWYFYWVPHLNTTYHFGGHFFMGMEFFKGLNQLFEHWPKVLKQFYDAPLKYTGFATFLIGLFLCIRHKKWIYLVVFLIPFTSYLLIIIKTGEMFTVNYHYPYLFVPSMAFVAGLGLSQLRSEKLVFIILFIVGIEGIANQAHMFRIREPFKSFTELEKIVDEAGIQQDDLITVNGHHPHLSTPLYFAHRKGWNVSRADLLKPGQIEQLKKEGCKYILVLKKAFGDYVELEFPKVHDSDNFAIYKL